MNKRGFTLIELLAVIVILAIIALIAVPIVLSIISNSKESASLRSAEMYLDAVEYGISDKVMNNKTIPNGIHSIMENGNICIGTYSNKVCTGDIIEVEVNGEVPKEGSRITFEEGKIKDVRLTYSNNKTIIKDTNGKLVYVEEEIESGEVEYTAYSVGDEVTVGTENFYVIVDSDKTQEKVTLLAKYNIDTTNLVQSATAGTVAFSSTNYWGNEESWEDWENLNLLEVPEGVTSVITIAKAYGELKGGIGRLMTYEEAAVLETTHAEMLFGINLNTNAGYLQYWLSRATSSWEMYFIDGYYHTNYSHSGSCLGAGVWSYTESVGVRPVVEISKSKIN